MTNIMGEHQVELSSSAPTKEPFLRIGSKRMSKNFNPFSSKAQGAEKESQLPSRLLQLTKSKEKKEKKKKGKGGKDAQTGTVRPTQSEDGHGWSGVLCTGILLHNSCVCL